jgi:hypothetical protein
MKFNNDEVTLASVVDKVKQKTCMEVWIIDRENAGQVNKPLLMNENTLWIEVVNKDNKNLAKGSYIVAESRRKDAADTIISFLIYEICKCKVGKIVLVTQDHFGTTLCEIIKNLYRQEMECVEPKDFANRVN